MLPVIAIVGRPNVGKSTLFNAITKSRTALVYDMPGVTRDRQYGEASLDEKPFIVIDTGGLSGNDIAIDEHMANQSIQAIEEADQVYFVVDGKGGLTSADEYIASLLRTRNKETALVVNKVDGVQEECALSDFYQLGLGEPFPVSASHRKGINHLLEATLSEILNVSEEDTVKPKGIKFALIGKPNVGKSTLTNRMIGDDRVVVYDQPGTTRDSIYIPFSRFDKDYTIIDTAGVRRKSKVGETLEKFSIVKTLQAIRDAHVVVIVIDARESLTDQDLHLIGFAIHSGRSIVVAINKWDGMKLDDKEQVKKQVDRRMQFVRDFADIYYISALHGTNVGHIFESIDAAYESANKKLTTTDLTNALKIAMEENQPPMSGRFRIKPKYAHLGGHNPPVIVIHGTQVDKLPNNYQRYLIKFFREAFQLVGTPLSLELKATANPFEGKKNKLTERQEDKRRRFKKVLKKRARKS
ncbi:ribosome biogenesis GTPase Der [Francisellaceae bacterium]|nr:ribosome biogenesis GTPase Der [Francisellaceae bacterium]